MHRVIAWLLPLALAVSAGRASADEIRWRHDYNTARKEAEEKNRPLMIDFGTEHCFWCKRLDATTFQEPSVVSLLNEQYIPVKIDAEREAALAQTLHIASYPTIVFGAPDGRTSAPWSATRKRASFSASCSAPRRWQRHPPRRSG